MRILVFQHIAVEHPGSLRGLMAAGGIAWDTVALDEGAAIPSLDGYAALLVMGGPMDVWEEDRHPWLAAEKAAIDSANPNDSTLPKSPYVGVQFAAIPEFQSIGISVGQQMSAALAGKTTVDAALKAGQVAAEREMKKAGYYK